jgi:parvulin-like peptidyl-prolyl isomerase
MRVLLALWLPGFFLGFPAVSLAEVINGIAAIVHDSIITYEDVQNEIFGLLPSLQAKFGDQPLLYQQEIHRLERERIEILVERQLILHEFKTAGYNLPESIIEDIIKARIRERFGDRLTLEKTLQAQGTTYESYKQSVRDLFIVEQMRIKNVSSSELIVSPYKIEAYYKDNLDKYKLGDQVKLRMIVLLKAKHDDGVARLAREIHTKIKEGAPFAEMAAIYSDGSQSSQGGDWGWVEKTVLRQDLAKEAFALKPGELSDVLESAEGYYIMLVEEARPAHVRPLAEVRDEIEGNLKRQERARLEKKWIDRLKSKAFIRYFPEAR